MTGLEIILLSASVFFAVLAFQEWLIASVEREKGKKQAESASFWCEMYQDSEGYHERTHDALLLEQQRRGIAEAKLANVRAQRDSTGEAWGHALDQPRHLPSLTDKGRKRDNFWSAVGDEPIYDAAAMRRAWGLPTADVIDFPRGEGA